MSVFTFRRVIAEDDDPFVVIDEFDDNKKELVDKDPNHEYAFAVVTQDSEGKFFKIGEQLIYGLKEDGLEEMPVMLGDEFGRVCIEEYILLGNSVKMTDRRFNKKKQQFEPIRKV